jgi:hypothetical protein
VWLTWTICGNLSFLRARRGGGNQVTPRGRSERQGVGVEGNRVGRGPGGRSGARAVPGSNRKQGQRQKQIPCGDDNQKGQRQERTTAVSLALDTPPCRTIQLCGEDGAPGPRAQDNGRSGQRRSRWRSIPHPAARYNCAARMGHPGLALRTTAEADNGGLAGARYPTLPHDTTVRRGWGTRASRSGQRQERTTAVSLALDTPPCRTIQLCGEDGAPGPRAQDNGKGRRRRSPLGGEGFVVLLGGGMVPGDGAVFCCWVVRAAGGGKAFGGAKGLRARWRVSASAPAG